MSGIFMTQRGMADIRRSENIMNSIIKRRKINGYAVPGKCGCSNHCGGGYIREHVPKPEVKTVVKPTAKERRRIYQEWMRIHAR